MPDISMCAHAECPSRKSCYRHADERPSDNTRHATSPGVTAGASAVEDDLCGRLRVYALAEDIMSSERRDLETAATRILSLSADRKSTRLNSSHSLRARMPSSA